MKVRHRQPARLGLFLFTAFWMFIVLPLSAAAAPYAAMVMDARSGQVLHAENADTRLHPASLTKMMTLYIAFEAVENGEIGLDDEVRITRNAAAEPPSKLGLRAGQRIKLRYLIRAAAVKSANDAATAIGEAISGSEAAFARRMNRTAKAMGMTRTTFKNAHGLTEAGHLSTARDMTILGRHVLYDYPQYYNLFSRQVADAGVRKVSHTNRRLLQSYRGADGIKTGYTRAAGFNLVASAERGGERVIATVFGGRSTATRNARVAELLDLGFKKSPTHVALHRPARPPYLGETGSARVVAAVARSLRPMARPAAAAPALPDPVAVALKEEIDAAIREVQVASAVQVTTDAAPLESETAMALVDPAAGTEDAAEAAAQDPVVAALVAGSAAPLRTIAPAPRPSNLVLASIDPADAVAPQQEVVERVSTSGGRHWGISIGRYPSRYAAEKMLLKTALAEMSTLDGSLRKVVNRPGGFEANFMGLDEETAELACRRLQARNLECTAIGPS